MVMPKVTGVARRRVACGLLALLGVAGGAGGAHGQAPTAPAGSPQGVPVQVAAAARRDVPVVLRNIGSVQALNTVLVRARVDGTIERVLFAEGQDVTAGQPLVQIDPRPYAAALAQARAKRAADEAGMANAQRDLGRYTNLARSEFASRQQVDTQQATVQQTAATLQGDDAQIASAQLNLDYATVALADRRQGGAAAGRRRQPGPRDRRDRDRERRRRSTPSPWCSPCRRTRWRRCRTRWRAASLPAEAFAGDDRLKLGQGELLTIDNQIDAATGTIRLKADLRQPGQPAVAGPVRQRPPARGHPGARAGGADGRRCSTGRTGCTCIVMKPDQTVVNQPIEVTQDDGQDAVVGQRPGRGRAGRDRRPVAAAERHQGRGHAAAGQRVAARA